MKNVLNARRQKEKSQADTQPDGEKPQKANLKQASRRDMYTICLNAGLGRFIVKRWTCFEYVPVNFSVCFPGGVANKFGLTPEQFGENLRDNYQRHETEQYPIEPNELAQDFITPQFDSR